MRSTTLAAALCGTALLLAFASTAAAQDACREDCREDLTACRGEARAALAACRGSCAEGDPRCEARCEFAHRARVTACGDRALRCSVGCREGIDPACAADCFEDHADCRRDQLECASDCFADLRGAVVDCYEAGGNVRACVAAAGEVARLCLDGCRDDHLCRRETRACLAECVVAE
jgi:hypothetical protein